MGTSHATKSLTSRAGRQSEPRVQSCADVPPTLPSFQAAPQWAPSDDCMTEHGILFWTGSQFAVVNRLGDFIGYASSYDAGQMMLWMSAR